MLTAPFSNGKRGLSTLCFLRSPFLVVLIFSFLAAGVMMGFLFTVESWMVFSLIPSVFL
uniref:Uncharacterized protein n=1 Tax=Rhizophora mucronata TaxID=61149 RepID=A0A2P2NW71_RHIMU